MTFWTIKLKKLNELVFDMKPILSGREAGFGGDVECALVFKTEADAKRVKKIWELSDGELGDYEIVAIEL